MTKLQGAGLPRVSIVIPTHNRPDFLDEALASVRAQTFTDYEIIVISNGENLESASRKIASKHGCRYFELDEANLSAARNFAIGHAKGDWIAFLDDDDLWVPWKLERQIAAARRSGADMVSCDYVEFHSDGRKIVRRPRLLEGWSYTKALGHGFWWAAPSAVMIRKRVFTDVGAFDPRLHFTEENDMWRRISWRHALYQVDELLMRYRIGHVSLSHQQHERKRYFYDLRHFVKMWRDTPRDLRSEVPPAAVYIFPRLVGICAPRWLLTFLHWFGPRRRWLGFRWWINSRPGRSVYQHAASGIAKN